VCPASRSIFWTVAARSQRSSARYVRGLREELIIVVILGTGAWVSVHSAPVSLRPRDTSTSRRSGTTSTYSRRSFLLKHTDLHRQMRRRAHAARRHLGIHNLLRVSREQLPRVEAVAEDRARWSVDADRLLGPRSCVSHLSTPFENLDTVLRAEVCTRRTRCRASPRTGRYGGCSDLRERLPRTISQRELRNDSGAIMRALDRGEVFLVTRNGFPVGELRPARRRFVESRPPP
jgi:hypothetical protein